MSKSISATKGKTLADVGYGLAYVVYQDTPRILVGKLLTHIEAMGLKDTQEKATKNIIEQIIWSAFDDSVEITNERHTALRKEWLVAQSENGGHTLGLAI